MPHKDRAVRIQYNKDHYQKNKEAIKAASNLHYATHAERIRAERMLKRDKEFKAKHSAIQMMRYRKIKAEVFAAFGSICACCGETEIHFLELDHINSDGANHRRSIGRGAHASYLAVKRLGFPRDMFRLLCANCNQGRQRNGGICPHERKTNLIHS